MEKDYKEIFDKVVSNMSDYLVRNNIKTMVLGLSGGIDSTVVAALAYKVCIDNPDIQLIGVSLPSKTNMDDEVSNAEMCRSFCNKYIEHSIQEEYNMFSNSLSALCDNTSTSIAEGNIKARIRMLTLYHIAGLNKGVVMDTDNLTEHHLGFFTLHGDVGDIAPIANLWKHEVYEFARYLTTREDIYNCNMVSVLKRAIAITPTDGNGVQAGGDMAQIAPGCSYKDVDWILYNLVVNDYVVPKTPYDEKLKYISSLETKVSFENCKRILDRYERNKYKHNLPVKYGNKQYYN